MGDVLNQGVRMGDVLNQGVHQMLSPGEYY